MLPSEKTQAILHYLLVNKEKRTKQLDVKEACNCSKSLVSKIVNYLIDYKMAWKPARTRVEIIDPLKLLFLFCTHRSLPRPVIFDFPGSKKDILEWLEHKKHALTLFTAYSKRYKEFRTNKIEVYLEEKQIKELDLVRTKRGNLVAFPSSFEFYGSNYGLVSLPLNIADLFAVGGYSINLALNLLKTF